MYVADRHTDIPNRFLTVRIYSSILYIYIYIYIYICLRAVFARAHTHTHTHTYIYIYVYALFLRARARTHTHTHTYIYTHIHTHTHTYFKKTDWNRERYSCREERNRGTHYHEMDAKIQKSDMQKNKRHTGINLYIYFISSEYKCNKKNHNREINLLAPEFYI